jgi:hypothetical protein
MQYKQILEKLVKLAETTAALKKSHDTASELSKLKRKLDDDLDQVIQKLAAEL